MHKARVDGEEYIVHREVSFDVVEHKSAYEGGKETYSSGVCWPNGKPAAVTPDLASWLRRSGVEPEEHDIRVIGDEHRL